VITDENPLAGDVRIAEAEYVPKAETDDSTIEPTAIEPTPAKKSLRQRLFGRLRALAAVVLALLIVAGAATVVWQYATQYRSDVGTDAAVAATATAAAEAGTVALLSYSPEHLESDFTAAKSHLTGDFLAYYNKFTEQVVAPAARERKVKTTAEVTRSAVSEMHPGSAKVLLFINQATTSSDKPDATLTSSSVLVTLDKHGDSWLISGFDPV
jgi:Mce-associated membrane protein